MPAFQAEVLFACLDRHGVQYVLIGGLAAVLHGSPLPTLDADICPSTDPDNLERLAAALDDLDARIRTPDTIARIPSVRPVPLRLGGELLAAGCLALTPFDTPSQPTVQEVDATRVGE